jgi:acyl dehydratase
VTSNATERIEAMIETDTQRQFSRDFLTTWSDADAWEHARIGDWQRAPGQFTVTEADVLAYNRAVGETHPMYVDPDYARSRAPRGTILVHPVFATTLMFWFSQPGAQGAWVRTPGARNPFQRIVVHQRVEVGDVLVAEQENSDKFWRRGKSYLTTHARLSDQHGAVKLEVWGTLILPPTSADVRAFLSA